ncbi:hypothetical protein [Nocardia sp. NPDC050435]|uniref:hypothetical protein n=1 Tax=Nocardia sp. NPDC050435 TaxID=3155040 RepID=UPI0034055697
MTLSLLISTFVMVTVAPCICLAMKLAVRLEMARWGEPFEYDPPTDRMRPPPPGASTFDRRPRVKRVEPLHVQRAATLGELLERKRAEDQRNQRRLAGAGASR